MLVAAQLSPLAVLKHFLAQLLAGSQLQGRQGGRRQISGLESRWCKVFYRPSALAGWQILSSSGHGSCPTAFNVFQGLAVAVAAAAADAGAA